jgi:hypothetical protein
MSVSIQSLQAHINKVLSGIRFSDIEMDSRVDLILEYGFPIEDVAAMSATKVYEILDNDGVEKTRSNEYGITCSKCGSVVDLEYTDNPYDHYYTICDCGHSDYISVYAIDAIMEQREIESIANDVVKNLMENVVLYPANNKKEEVLSNGILIQEIEADDIYKFYEYNGSYYRLECWSNGTEVLYLIKTA